MVNDKCDNPVPKASRTGSAEGPRHLAGDEMHPEEARRKPGRESSGCPGLGKLGSRSEREGKGREKFQFFKKLKCA